MVFWDSCWRRKKGYFHAITTERTEGTEGAQCARRDVLWDNRASRGMGKCPGYVACRILTSPHYLCGMRVSVGTLLGHRPSARRFHPRYALTILGEASQSLWPFSAQLSADGWRLAKGQPQGGYNGYLRASQGLLRTRRRGMQRLIWGRVMCRYPTASGITKWIVLWLACSSTKVRTAWVRGRPARTQRYDLLPFQASGHPTPLLPSRKKGVGGMRGETASSAAPMASPPRHTAATHSQHAE